jgi:hypothetical protein
MEIKPKSLTDKRFTPNIKRIWVSFAMIITAGITAFYFAKKEINDNRQRIMLVKKEINETKTKYPSRMDIIRELREKEKQSNQSINN